MARSRKTTKTPDKTETDDAVAETVPVEDAEVIEEIPAGAAPDAAVEGASAEGAETSEDGEIETAGPEAEQGADETDADASEPDPADVVSDATEEQPGAEGSDAAAAPDSAASEPVVVAGALPGAGGAPAPASGQDQQPPSPHAAPPQRAAHGVIPLVIGGIIAAAIGFGAAQLPQLGRSDPDAPTPEQNAAALEAQTANLAALESQIAGLAARDLSAEIAAGLDAGLGPLSDRLTDAEKRLDALSGEVSALRERVETIALRPVGTGIEAGEFDDALAQFRDQLNAAISSAEGEIAEARAAAREISEQAYSAEQAATARAAWGQVRIALDSGSPYAEALEAVAAIVGAEVPPALSGPAETGIPTLSALQEAYPDAARAALQASIRARTGDSAMDRLTAFVRVHSGLRSLAPREGDDPDAVLSRIEAALRQGDLDRALTEADGLPEAGQAALTGWIAQTRTRLDAVAAAQAFSAQVNVN